MKKRVCSVLLAAAMLMSLMTPLSSLAEEYVALTLNEEVTVTLGVGGEAWYQFTPDNSKTYCFVSSNADTVDPVAALYNSSMTLIAENDDDDGSNFKITAELTAGETYYLKAYEFGMNDAGSYTLTVKLPLPTDVWFDEYSMTVFAGTEYTVKSYVYPDDADRTLTWTSSDESVATVDENGKVTFLAGGETAIKAETPNGLSDTCWFTVKPVMGELTLNSEKMLTCIGYEERVQTEQTFTFTPSETGYYRLYSYDIVSENSDITSVDPRVWVRDAVYNELEYDDDGGEDVNVSVDVALTAGETYYFTLEQYDAQAIGSFKIMLEQIDTADSVSIDGGDLVMEQGDVRDIYVTYSPAGTWQEDYEVTSSDTSVVEVDDKTILAVGGGEATVTVTTELGLTDSIKVTVYALDKIELDTTYTFRCLASDYGAYKRYIFTPTESGRYTIASSEAVGTNVTVGVAVSDGQNQLRYHNTESATFKLTYELRADERYYYEVFVNCTDSDASVDFVLTKEDNTDIPKAVMNTDYTAEITNPGDGAYYAFTPKFSGMYAIFSTLGEDADLDPKLIVFDKGWEMFYSDDDGGENSCYRLEEEFTAGETYYLKNIIWSNDDVGAYTMRIEPLFELPTMGELNGDNTVNMLDCTLLYSVLATGGPALTQEQLAISDFNEDGFVNMFDVLLFYGQISGV